MDRERVRQTETERETHTQTETQREAHTHRERERETHTQTEREREGERLEGSDLILNDNFKDENRKLKQQIVEIKRKQKQKAGIKKEGKFSLDFVD